MSKHKDWSFTENPFRWQVQVQYQKLVEAVRDLSKERLQEIGCFIHGELEGLRGQDGYLSQIHSSLIELILETLHNHIKENVLTFANYQREKAYQEERQRRIREAEETAFEEDCSGMEPWEKDIMRGAGYGPPSSFSDYEEDEMEVKLTKRKETLKKSTTRKTMLLAIEIFYILLA